MKTLKSMLIVVAAAIAMLSTASMSPAVQPTMTSPYGTQNGTLSVSPQTFFAGQEVTVSANFPSGRFTVALFVEVNPGSGQFQDVAFDESNSNGNAYFDGIKIDGPTQMYAQMEYRDVGGHTAIRTFAPETVDPTGQPAAGSLRTNPETYYQGQEVQIAANFPDGIFVVTLFEETTPGSGDYEVAGTDESSKSGNAYFNGYEVDGARKLFALTADGRYSAVRTLAPAVVDPTGNPAAGSLSWDLESYFPGQKLTIAANFASGVFLVTLFRETAVGSNQYEVAGTDQSNSNGNAYFPGYEVDGARKVFALTETGRYSEVRTLEPKPVVMPNTSTGVIRFDPEEVRSDRPVTVIANFLSRCRNVRVDFFRDLGRDNYWFIGSAVSDSQADAYLRGAVLHKEAGRTYNIVAVTSRGCPSGGPERTDFESVDWA